MEVITSLKTLKVSENSWVFSSALLWSVHTSSPWLNIFSSGIVTLANFMGRDPNHRFFGLHFSKSVMLKMPIKKEAIQFTLCCFTAYFSDPTASPLFQDMHLRIGGSTTEMYAILDSVWGYCFVWPFFTISRRMGIYPGLNIPLLLGSPMTLSRSEIAALRLNL